MDKIRNLSLRKTIILYMCVSLVCSFILAALTAWAAENIQNRIWWKYTDQDKYFEAQEMEDEGFWVQIPRPDASEMSKQDYNISEACDFLQTYSVLVLSVAGSCVAVFLFYRNKLRTPIRELEEASGRIAENDLDFQLTYENRDEMGQLCREFDRMREQLEENNRKMWRMVEDERELRAAIAHDIRSPLSVLKGYQEMLLTYLPDGTIDTRQATEMLKESMKQISRMDVFIETMRRVNSLEQRALKAEGITAEQLREDIRGELNILAEGKKAVLNVQETKSIFRGDREVILEVAENLFSNAFRYARKQIRVQVSLTASVLKISVSDDGTGFQEDAEKITRAFHQKNVKDSLTHTGMGMYISRLYCEKHGGKLLLENNEAGGASVTAVFGRIK
ncbi:MAG TPA: HAMP domain-containing histidine kinase [Candidatus Mediterraneibacter excrementigallinarum]|mgnify:FL=1|nr:HAMP domain-containing histidine kinase [Candidatus Mediterraneibacter excrementigallinarum]